MKKGWRREAQLFSLSAGMALMCGVFLALSVQDGQEILGLNRWFKPAKFAASISIYAATAALLLGPLAGHSLMVRLIRQAVFWTMLGEMLLIGLQAARGTTSHFNTSSPLDAAIFHLMGALIAVNTVAAALLLREYTLRAPLLSPALLLGIRAGLWLFLAGSLEAIPMLVLSRHTVGAPDGGPGLPFVNWSTQHGDLRAAHFFALHALQALPLTAILLPSVKLIRILAWAWAAGFAFLLTGALLGIPLLKGLPFFSV